MTCDHGKYEGKRCRKRARFAIQHRIFFAYRIGPNGSEPFYSLRVVMRCGPHATVDNETGRMDAESYCAQKEPVNA